MTARRVLMLCAFVVVVLALAWFSPDIARWLEGLTS